MLYGMLWVAAAWGMPEATSADACPVEVAGTQLRVVDTPRGVSLTFTTERGRAEVAELRRRVRAFSAMLTSPAMQEGTMPSMDGDRMGSCQRMHSAGGAPGRPTVRDVRGGARLNAVPVDVAQLQALRARLHMVVAHLDLGECPMMLAGIVGPASES